MHIFPAYRVMFPRGFRQRHLRHNRQIHDYSDGSESRLFQRSIFGLVYSYNLLPQSVVDCKCTHTFQKSLQKALKCAARIPIFSRKTFFTSGVRRMTVSRFQKFFHPEVDARKNQSNVNIPFFHPSTETWW